MKTITESHEYDSLNMRPAEVISQGYQLGGDALESFAIASCKGLKERISSIYVDAVNEAESQIDQMELF